jgi:hypothetical protein
MQMTTGIPTRLYAFAFEHHADKDHDLDAILRDGMKMSSDFVALFATPERATEAVHLLMRCGPDDIPIVVEVDVTGLPVSDMPPLGVFIDGLPGMLYCHADIPPDRISEYDANHPSP